MGYTVVLQKEPDGAFVVTVPSLPGCVSQGESRAEALANIREAIEVYVEDCRAAGDPFPEQDERVYLDIDISDRHRSYSPPPGLVNNK